MDWRERDYTLVSSGGILGASFALLGATWPDRVISSGGSGLATLGLVVGAFSLARLAGSLSTLRLQVVKAPAVIPIALVGISLSILAYGGSAAQQTAILLLVVAAMGLSSGILDTGANAVSASSDSTALVGWLHLAFPVGAAAAIATASLTRGVGFSTVFIAVAAWTAITSIYAFRVRGVLRADLVRRPRSRRPLDFAVLVAAFMGVMVEASVGGWLAPVLVTKGLSVLEAQVALGAYWLTYVLGRFLFVRFPVSIGVLSLASVAVAVLAFPAMVLGPPVLAALAAPAIGMGLGLIMPTLVIRSLPNRESLDQASLLISAATTGAIVGPVASAVAIDNGQAVLVAIAGATALAIVWQTLWRTKEPG